mmetsp:Transcript_4238/g.5822  ORF Transcript_4238/g.5822 Transcript_4238/m.5822 type:complete len:141 (+) Transcript_4238:6-428(+)
MRKTVVEEVDEFSLIEKKYYLKIIHPGDAVNFPRHGDSVAVNYAGFLEDGSCFDNTYNRGQPIYFILGAKQVIAAWEDVLPVLSRGEKARIVVPPELGYGDRGYPPIIPPRATLTFEIELMTFTSVGHVERLHRERKLQS